MSLYDFMCWISTLQLYGNRLNILGLIWLGSLVTYTYLQIRKPISDLRAEKGWKRLGTFRMMLLALIPVMLSHFISDETHTFLMIGFGHFQTYMGTALTIQSLWATKFDVYLSILALGFMFILLDVYTRFQWAWPFLLFGGMWFAFHVYVAFVNVGDFSAFQDWERFWRFWSTYPLSKGLLAFTYLSLLKKDPLAPKLHVSFRFLARIIDVGRHSMMARLSSPSRFGLNLGSGNTRYENKINVDVDPNVDVDFVMDARHLHFPAHSFKEVLMDQVLEHIPEDQRALKEVYRVLQAPGFLIVSVPQRGVLAKLDKILLHPREHHSSYSRAQLEKLFQDSGFRVLASFIYGTLPHYLRIPFGGSLFMVGVKD